jgi:hypothetical protein
LNVWAETIHGPTKSNVMDYFKIQWIVCLTVRNMTPRIFQKIFQLERISQLWLWIHLHHPHRLEVENSEIHY